MKIFLKIKKKDHFNNGRTALLEILLKANDKAVKDAEKRGMFNKSHMQYLKTGKLIHIRRMRYLPVSLLQRNTSNKLSWNILKAFM